MNIILALVSGFFTIAAAIFAAYVTFKLQSKKGIKTIKQILDSYRQLELLILKYREILQADFAGLIKISSSESISKSNMLYLKFIVYEPVCFDYSFLHIDNYRIENGRIKLFKEMQDKNMYINDTSDESSNLSWLMNKPTKVKEQYICSIKRSDKEAYYLVFLSNKEKKLPKEDILIFLDQVSQGVEDFFKETPDLMF